MRKTNKINKKAIAKIGAALITALIFGIILIFLIISLLSSSASLSSASALSSGSIQSSESSIIQKQEYLLDEKIKINLKNIKDYEIKITTPSTSYIKHGSENTHLLDKILRL